MLPGAERRNKNLGRVGGDGGKSEGGGSDCCGRFNLGLEITGGWGKYNEITAAVATSGLEDITGCFLS